MHDTNALAQLGDDSTDRKRWMSRTTAIHAQKLRFLCIPSTHDTGTYDLKFQLTSEQGEVLQYFVDTMHWLPAAIEKSGAAAFIPSPMRWTADLAMGAIRLLSQTTARNVRQQLEDGMRCIDLRIYHTQLDSWQDDHQNFMNLPSAKEFYTYHTLVGASLRDIFRDVRDFLDATDGEIVYITLGHYLGLEYNDELRLDEMVREYFGDRAIRRVMNGDAIANDLFQQTYEELVHQGGKKRSRVVLVMTDPAPTNVNDPMFWPEHYSAPNGNDDNSVLFGKYTNTPDLDDMLRHQREQLEHAVERDLPFALYMTLTPTPKQDTIIVGGVISRALTADAVTATAIILPPLGLAIATALGLAATGFDVADSTIPFSTLEDLSSEIYNDLDSLVKEKILHYRAGINPLTFLYLDFYEKSKAVDLARELSVGFAPSGHALSFDDNGDGYVRAPYRHEMAPGSDGDELIVDTWVFLPIDNEPSPAWTIIACDAFSITAASNGAFATLSGSVTGQTSFTSAGVIPLGNWVHIELRWRKGTSVDVMVDGVVVTTNPLTVNEPLSSFGNAVYLGIASDGRSSRFSGLLGPTALKRSHDAYLAYWRLDQEKGSTVEDSSNRGNKARLVGKGLSWIDAPGMARLTCDGCGQGRVRVPPSPSLWPADPSTLTLSAWIRLTRDGATEMSILSAPGIFCLGIGTGTTPSTRTLTASFGAQSFLGAAIPFDTWTFVSASWSAQGLVALSVGADVVSTPTSLNALPAGSGDLLIGGSPPLSGQLRAAGVSGTVANEPTVIGFWPLCEGDGRVAHDISGNANEGDIEGDGVTWSAPIRRAALAFDGTGGSHVEIAPWEQPESPSNELRASAWVNLPQTGIGAFTVIEIENVFQLMINTVNAGQPMVVATLNVVGESTMQVQVGGQALPLAGQWSFLEVTWRDGVLTVNCNGAELGNSGNHSGAVPSTPARTLLGIDVAGQWPYRGLLGAVAIEVAGKKIGMWPNDEGAGVVTFDHGGDQRDGEIRGTSGLSWVVYP